MKPLKALFFMLIIVTCVTTDLIAQVGFFDAPYTRYEADQGDLNGAAVLAATFNQGSLQSEASEQVCVNLFNSGSSVSWTTSAAGDGLVVRYSVPDGQSGTVDVYSGATFMGTLNMTSNWSWESLYNNGNPNNVGISNTNPKMRFDEVRMKLPSQIPAGGTLKLVRTNGNVTIDFAELEPVPPEVTVASGDVYYNGVGSGIQGIIDANPGKTIYLAPGVYQVGSKLWFQGANTTLKGAGMWYTQINFTSGAGDDGGLWAKATNISFNGLYLTTNRNSRSSSYKAINGSFIGGSKITNVWAEHFECGAWIAVYDNVGPDHTDGLQMSYCRFRNNYADGTNLCKGTVNTVVEHCSYRNNGDDDMAIWSANSWECANNTFRYCTSENTWRSAGVAIYGGSNNKAQNILIQDNVEVGIKVNNAFPGSPFNTMNELSNIIIKRCGTSQDLFNKRVGAIEMGAYNSGAGTQVKNVTFSCISIIDSKRDAIFMHKDNGDGFYNILFQNITINGTGKDGSVAGTGVLVENNPGGSATYCGMTYTSAGTNTNTGGYSFNAAGTCPTGCSLSTSASSTKITSTSTFGVCSTADFTATSTAASGKTTSSVEFFVDNTSIGSDNTSPYEATWTSPTVGTHQVKAVSTYSDGSSSTSPVQTITVADAIYPTGSSIVWTDYKVHDLNVISVGGGNISSATDLSANFKVTRDATNLYIFVDVTDDNLSNDAGFAYDNDQVELFIDRGNNKAGAYDGSDYSYNFLYNSSVVGATNSSPTTGITATPGTKTGGYTMSIKIPWTTLGYTAAPAAGTFIGLEVQVDDDDGGGTRDSKIAWTDATDIAWKDPSVFGTIQIASCNNPLPVELVSFTLEKNNETNVLYWSTATEKNNQEFIIERSATASDWKVIGNVKGAGNSSALRNYLFIDTKPLSGLNYYRLRQVDIDAKIAYSPILIVQNSVEHASVSIAPNPFTETLTIISTSSSSAVIKIYDLSGRVLFETSAENTDGSVTIQPLLPSGSYIMTVQTDATIDQFKIIKRD